LGGEILTGPYAPYSANIVVIATELQVRINAAKATFTTPVVDVWYGDQDRIGTTPTVCIEPSDKTRELSGAPNMTENNFEIYILVYHNKVQDNQITRKEVDQLAFEIEKLLHQDLQLATAGVPRLIHGYVTRNESGYVWKNGTLYRTARLTYRGKNKTSLPVS
jgi:hypothetical protein